MQLWWWISSCPCLITEIYSEHYTTVRSMLFWWWHCDTRPSLIQCWHICICRLEPSNSNSIIRGKASKSLHSKSQQKGYHKDIFQKIFKFEVQSWCTMVELTKLIAFSSPFDPTWALQKDDTSARLRAKELRPAPTPASDLHHRDLMERCFFSIWQKVVLHV